ncbi:hypothetical protein MLP_33670 [Microlunatus phosphovorus NM-1]|uniref:Polymerase beta nucleotidyltransferase domain-containing protein n=1 Tax=Microlunatus phosphovorus (strain ATCC 700054 / DSM 10555 / JCM 9379 / NBRC 101784 / NCIMB 13414 / VKM Ac-1990 / NM-1) TaxID=1032480 RepID=F5XMC4_MICPN|nr:nucleotidyltransferase domain-containing protein [Microlunatus phosphovorus]BAK36381.1 hypothetical protein MLP_33670 [Microlunatus phosphovorus NM-1]
MYFSEPFGGVVPGARGAVLAALMRTGTPMTGRQIHGLLADRYSLWTVQQALKESAQLGLTSTAVVGRAGVHSINEDHVAIVALRRLLSPIDNLADVVRDACEDDIQAVILFGSVARGEAQPASDVDLAVIAPPTWDGRIRLEDAVRSRLGNECDIIHLSMEQFLAQPTRREPVVAEILRDGIALLGEVPRADLRSAS